MFFLKINKIKKNLLSKGRTILGISRKLHSSTLSYSLEEENNMASSPPPSSASSGPPPHPPSSASTGGSRVRRDFLLDIEKKMQKLWEEKKAYEIDAPISSSSLAFDDNEKKKKEKFYCTFPYAYMNGCLHLGHAFSLTKAEFAARFERMLGKNVLWPYAFHCTGMPILASAVKLKREVEEMQKAEKKETEEHNLVEEKAEEETSSAVGDVSKFSSKKSKAVSKTGNTKSQWEIMKSMGIREEEIPKFADPLFWLHFFPPLAVHDLKSFGVAVDWRRSFITTDVNPYYDAFVKWQFRLLKARNKVKFGMRNAVFSRVEHQPCADHDRASGEGVCPQEFTLVKMEVQEIPQKWKSLAGENLEGKRVYLTPATLRPETMYGQTNCFVLPEGTYGFFLGFDSPLKEVPSDSTEGVLEISLSREEALKRCSSIYVCSKRSALNMAYQGIVPLETTCTDSSSSSKGMPEPHCLFEISGQDLIGVPLSAPNAVYKTVYALPLLTISMDKGTGIVASVPSDSPVDYAALTDMKNKKDFFRDKYGVKAEWLDPFDVVEIIEIPGLGRQIAPELHKQKKISSQKDKQKLDEATEEAYRRGFYEGILIVGPHKGKKVCDVKNIVRDELINRGDALAYSEPEKKVMSRSGEECVVALCNQWYIDYGEESWRNAVEKHINNPEAFNAYSERALNQFQHVVQWLKGWACSRHYGLGSCLPWEEEKQNRVLIESLSDSTIYMAYYLIAHFLQGDINGSKPGLLGIKPEQLTDDVFDYVFRQTDTPPKSDIPLEKLNLMRSEFSYWYPMDLRASGKDLIFNHLTMSLYNHAAIWDKMPCMWPRGFFCNGMVMVDAEKMSKSVGNFLTMRDSVDEFTADATRIGLADAGDSLDDSNFQRETANAAIMKLYLFEHFVKETIENQIPLRTGEKCSYDEFFENEIAGLSDSAKDAYTRLVYRDALKAAFFDFQTRRDQYRNMCGNKEMHKESVMLFIETQVKILSPIAPHVCEHIWTNLLKKPKLVVTELWPTFERNFDPLLHRQYILLLSTIEDFRGVRDKLIFAKGAKGGKQQAQQKPAPTHAVIYVAKEYMEWQQKILSILQKIELDKNGEPPADFMNIVKNDKEVDAFDKNLKKQAFSFASFQMREELKARGPSALELRLPFDEMELLEKHKEFICRSLGLKEVAIMDSSSSHPADSSNNRTAAAPGKPAFFLYIPSD